ncbi:hypothetical protein Taro_034682 [Colocasia esculenta]|uniref:Uncharacterized protein n=1 Tax=Colocasia esculenta TaxID=4460 RepID=A0A843WAT2_COLES|nr:hypothetical protein [Colocasia esculenta]
MGVSASASYKKFWSRKRKRKRGFVPVLGAPNWRGNHGRRRTTWGTPWYNQKGQHHAVTSGLCPSTCVVPSRSVSSDLDTLTLFPELYVRLRERRQWDSDSSRTRSWGYGHQ